MKNIAKFFFLYLLNGQQMMNRTTALGVKINQNLTLGIDTERIINIRKFILIDT